MSTFFGKIEKLIPFKGRIGRKPTGLKVEIQPVNELQGELQPVKGLRGSILAKHRFTGTGIRPLAAIYRFLSASSRLLLRHEAKVTTAPAQELKVEKPVTLATKAKLVKHSTVDLKVNRSIRMTVTARLVAYARAPAEYIKKLFIPSDAKLIAAPGKTAEHIRTLDFVRKSEMISAEAKTAKSVGSLTLVKKAECIEAPTQSGCVDSVMAIKHEAKAGTGAGAVLGLMTALGSIQHKAVLNYACFVTFLDGYDAELTTYRVNAGQACPDPIVEGVFAEPTKESDNYFHYKAFLGWGLAKDGEVVPDILENVTRCLTLYPIFEKEIRYYTVNFWDDTELVGTVQVKYGETAEYTYSKAGYDFIGWEPTNMNITQDTDCYAQLVRNIPALEDATWEYIAEAAEAGHASEYWAIGDTKSFTANGRTYRAQIADFDHDDLADGSGKAGISFIITYVWQSSVQWNSVNGASYQWSNCSLRTFCNGTIFGYFPADLQAVIKQVTKKSGNYKNTSATDSCWVPSATEIGLRSFANDGVLYPIFSDDASRVLAYQWHTRTTDPTRGYFIYVDTDGTELQTYKRAYKFIRFGFCI